MKKLILSCSLLLFFFFHSTSQETITNVGLDRDKLTAKADALLNQAVELKEFTGVAAGIFSENEIVWKNGAGFNNIETKEKTTGEMLHRLASISKPMTAVALMQLVEQGKVDLDATIQTYVPDFPKKPEGDITVRNLLNHSSGLDHFSNSVSTNHFNSIKEVVDEFKGKPLEFAPGTQYGYSTFAYNVIALVIENISGLSYVEYMQKNIWKPANMINTSIEEFGKSYSNKASLYQKDKKGNFKPDKKTDLSVKYPGGGIQSTVEDLLNFAKAIIHNQLIQRTTLEMMMKPQDNKKEGTPYGLGWFVVEDEKYGRIIRHGGRQSGTSTSFSIYLDQQVAFAVLSNNIDSSDETFALINKLIQNTLEPTKLNAPIRNVVSVPSKVLKKYLGAYQFKSGNVIKLSLDGNQMMTKIDPYPKFKLYPEAENKFFYRAFDAQFEFILDKNGKIEKTIYTQNGVEAFPKKIK